MIESVKLGFFKKILISVKDLEKYDELAIQPLKRTIGYFAKLIFIFAFILSILYSIQFFNLMISVKSNIDKIPDFQFSDGTVQFKESNPVIIENLSNIINSVLILPLGEENSISKEYISKIKTFNSYIILTPKDFNVTINDSRLQYEYKTLFENTSVSTFDKQDLNEKLKELNLVALTISIGIVLLLSMFIFYFCSIGLDIVITFLVAFLASKINRIKIKNFALVNIAIHSLTCSILLYLLYIIINILTGFEIAKFRLMYILIASVYATIAILIIKVDFIEKQQELAKVIKAQAEIHQEFENDDKNDDNNNDENDNKEKDNATKDDKKELEPEVEEKPALDASKIEIKKDINKSIDNLED